MTVTAIAQPRYRYHESAPGSISVPVSELLPRLPAVCRSENDPGEKKVDLPCRELLVGNTPRLSLGLLCNLLPDFVTLPEGSDQETQVALPGGWLALHFHLVTHREEILLAPETPEIKPVVGDAEAAPARSELPDESASSARIDGSKEVQPLPDVSETPKDQPASLPAGETVSQNGFPDSLAPSGNPNATGAALRRFFSLLIFRNHASTGMAAMPGESISPAPPESPGSSLPTSTADLPGTKELLDISSDSTEKKEDPPQNNPIPEIQKIPLRQPLTVDVVTTTVLEERPSLRGTPNRKRTSRHGFFASLPLFRRRTPVEVASQPEKPQPSLAATTPSVQQDHSTPVTIEPLWKLDPHNQVADPSALQALFMTEEKLTLERVIALAGQLPGLRACVLVHGSSVLCTSNTPPEFDLQTLSAQAVTMLSQIRESSANLGLGAVPAVTLHAEQGALSFLHNGELCLLVLHADRGFVPGVRERLQEMLVHLTTAKALPGGPSPQATLPI